MGQLHPQATNETEQLREQLNHLSSVITQLQSACDTRPPQQFKRRDQSAKLDRQASPGHHSGAESDGGKKLHAASIQGIKGHILPGLDMTMPYEGALREPVRQPDSACQHP